MDMWNFYVDYGRWIMVGIAFVMAGITLHVMYSPRRTLSQAGKGEKN